MTLVEFLEARFAEDEAGEEMRTDIRDGRGIFRTKVERVTPSPRALAEVEAKRAIVMEFEQVHADYRIAPTPTMEGQRFGLAKAVAALAGVYANHPDYRDEWRS